MKGRACRDHPEPVDPARWDIALSGYTVRVIKMVHGYMKPALAADTEIFGVVGWSSTAPGQGPVFAADGKFWTPDQYRRAYHECDDRSSVFYDITLLYNGEPVA